ncbi:MAG: hypothetical protein WCA20_06670 [Candidatus Sulfotelmatobacter sp.]
MGKCLEEEIKLASEFGSKIEELVVARGQCPTGERNTPLMAYWSLAFEFHKAILSLIANKFYGAAFALERPILEATVRAHLVVFVHDDVLKKILDDGYRMNFRTVGREIDDAFRLEGHFEEFLKKAKDALHGYTHVGMHQLGRRFQRTDLVPNYSEEEITEVIRTSTSAAFMVNNIVTKYLGFEEEWKETTRLFGEWGKSHPTCRLPIKNKDR